MVASRLDVEWDRGGDWSVIVARRVRSGVVLPAADPSVLEIRPIDARSDSPALLSVPGQVDDEGRVHLHASREQVASLPLPRYWQRLVITDAATSRPLVLLRGYLTLLDGAEGA